MTPLRLPLPRPQVPGVFVRRVNRFAAEVRVAAGLWQVHLPNSGRMEELLVPGARVRVFLTPGQHGKTQGRLLLIRHAGRWVGLDSHLPNRLWELALQSGGLPPVVAVRRWRREVRLGGERVDFQVQARGGTWVVETKSCNRVVGEVALFPDAPTARGARHLHLLAKVARSGGRAAVVWFVQRDDARCLQVDWESDPEFADSAWQARRRGVQLVAYVCSVTPSGVQVLRRIPVRTTPRHGSC
ncbi:MAG: DNA/RNA nuclease SfsA [Armatimonadota bacterium]|nr:DNA/RNA nuclease SfsA [Armatimonadota bacterium]MDW8157205.1 DNA/RNA nuclease SfsA [Armatimonadota bacterium]